MTVRERLRKDRPMTAMTIRVPEDVLRDLGVVTLRRGFESLPALVRAYVGQGLRKDLAKDPAHPEARLAEAEALLRWVRDEILEFEEDGDWSERIDAFLRPRPTKQSSTTEEP